MLMIAREAFADEIPTKAINDAPALIRIRRMAVIARARLELAPDIAAASDALEAIERAATEALT